VSSSHAPRISALFETEGGTLETPSVRVRVNGSDVTAQTYVTAAFFAYTPSASLPPGRVRVEVEGRVQRQGAAEELKDSWEFDIQDGAAAAPAANIPLTVVSPRMDDVVGQKFVVRGSTAPGARVEARITGHLPLAEHDLELGKAYATADSQGQFAVQMHSIAVIKGVHYTVTVTATDPSGKPSHPLRISVVGR